MSWEPIELYQTVLFTKEGCNLTDKSSDYMCCQLVDLDPWLQFNDNITIYEKMIAFNESLYWAKGNFSKQSTLFKNLSL